MFLYIHTLCMRTVKAMARMCISRGGGGGGGGGTLIFSAYVGSASTVHHKKYQKFEAPQKSI